ncbi:MAG: hypothetical protein QJR01_04145 [Kyrpidia sp.]|nr:hypothetical protein [Kyrpidia sp.]
MEKQVKQTFARLLSWKSPYLDMSGTVTVVSECADTEAPEPRVIVVPADAAY